MNSFSHQRYRYLKNVSTQSKGLLGSGWWGKKRVVYVFIMNDGLIQWIVYLDRACCHPNLRLGLFSFVLFFVV
jgi:hypothetical protein